MDDKENEIIESKVCEWSRRSDSSFRDKHFRLFVTAEDGSIKVEDCRTTSDNPGGQPLVNESGNPLDGEALHFTRSEARWLIDALTKALAFADELAGA